MGGGREYELREVQRDSSGQRRQQQQRAAAAAPATADAAVYSDGSSTPPPTPTPHPQIKLVQQGKPYVMFGDGNLAACKPISEADLARFMADCITGGFGGRWGGDQHVVSSCKMRDMTGKAPQPLSPLSSLPSPPARHRHLQAQPGAARRRPRRRAHRQAAGADPLPPHQATREVHLRAGVAL